MATAKPVGKGLIEKRGRILRCLHAHLGYLATVETMAPWTPPIRAPYPPRPLTSGQQRALPAYVYPRERPELAHPSPGPEALSEEDVKAWVEHDPFVRGGLSATTQRAMAFIATFAPRT